MPFKKWYGFKHVVYDDMDGNVVQELYFESNGSTQDGGHWQLINHFVDDGTNFGKSSPSCTSIPKDRLLKLTYEVTKYTSESGLPQSTVYFRTDKVNTDGMAYKFGSIREIDPYGSGGGSIVLDLSLIHI